MRLALLEARAMLDGLLERLERLRDAEALQEERQRELTLRENNPRSILEDWCHSCRQAFAIGERQELIERFEVRWGEHNTAEEIRLEYNRLMEIVESVMRRRAA